MNHIQNVLVPIVLSYDSFYCLFCCSCDQCIYIDQKCNHITIIKIKIGIFSLFDLISNFYFIVTMFQ